MLEEEGKILRTFGSETEGRENSRYRGYERRLKRREKSVKHDKIEQKDRNLKVCLGGQRKTRV